MAALLRGISPFCECFATNCLHCVTSAVVALLPEQLFVVFMRSSVAMNASLDNFGTNAALSLSAARRDDSATSTHSNKYLKTTTLSLEGTQKI